MSASPMIKECRSVEELNQLVEAIAHPTRFMERGESNADNEGV